MQLPSVKPNFVTFSYILIVCTTIRVLKEGMDIHQKVVENGFVSNIVVVSVLIDMYEKYGRIHNAQELFKHISEIHWFMLMIIMYLVRYELISHEYNFHEISTHSSSIIMVFMPYW